MKNENNLTQTEVQAIFRAVRELPIEPSPFLKTRVLASLRERQSHARGVRVWKSIAAGLVVGFSVMAIWILPTRPSGFQAEVNQNLLVKVDVQAASPAEVAFVAVELAEGVEFFSGGNVDIRRERRLVFPFQSEMAKSQFPFVVRGLAKGARDVKVTFLNSDLQPVGEKTITIRFNESKDSVI